jgi:hypothetical protein
MELEDAIRRLEIGIEALRWKAGGREAAYRDGFLNGLCFALLMARGQNVFDPQGAELAGVKPGKRGKGKRGQMEMF